MSPMGDYIGPGGQSARDSDLHLWSWTTISPSNSVLLFKQRRSYP
jgi:hypothetical protein